MKYLKKFNESDNSEFFYKINSDAFDEYLFENVSDLEDLSINKLSSLLEKSYKISIKKYHSGTLKYKENTKYRFITAYAALGIQTEKSPDSYPEELWVHECKDEWFLVQLIDDDIVHFYKCDQFEGLIEFLKYNNCI